MSDPTPSRSARTRSDQELLSGVALTAFKLNGQLLDVAEALARPVGLTAAWWQVLGAVMPAPLPVAGIAREMGITRQSVQRIADLLVDKGLAVYADNPAHRRAKLVRITEAGEAAVHQINPAHKEMARRLVDAIGPERLDEILTAMQHLSDSLTTLNPSS
ncbi:MAG TPA: MarR family transcriptional regulator [Micromonosporaceae bacterium]